MRRTFTRTACKPARSRAAEALKAVVAKWKRGKNANLPTFTLPFLEYDKRSATFHDDHASLSTVGGRITAEYVVPDRLLGTQNGGKGGAPVGVRLNTGIVNASGVTAAPDVGRGESMVKSHGCNRGSAYTAVPPPAAWFL